MGDYSSGSFFEQNARAYDALASDWDALVLGSPFYDNERRVATELLDRYVSKADPGQTALDIGCGSGNSTLHLLERGYAVTAFDASREMLRVTQAKTREYQDRRCTVWGDASDLSQLKGSYDYIVSFGSVINHLENWPKLLDDLIRLTNPGALLIFDVDNMFGFDYLMLAAYSRIFRWNYRPSLTDVVESVKAIRNSAKTTNRWPLVGRGGRTFDVHLTYWPLKRLLEMLGSANWEVLSISGANMISCLLPRVASSEVYAPPTPLSP